MNIKSLTLLTAAVALVSLGACTQRATDLPPGHYESESKSIDSQGTAHTRSTETDVEYDSNGNKKATSETTTSSDPKGLFNKSSSTTKTTETKKNY
jgi:hypothetical protein